MRRGAGRARFPRAELLERFPSIPADELEEHLSLLNLVNFGGGCYTVYAELHEGSVHVDKELWGDTFRAAPRLTPLEARAIRLALEYVGPMIAADAHTPLARVRKKLEETFGQFELARTPEPHVATEEVDLVSTLARGMRERTARRDRVPEGGRLRAVDAARRAVLVRQRAAELVRPHVGPDERRRAVVPARPDAERNADEGAFRAARRASSRRSCATPGRRGSSTPRTSPALRPSAAHGGSGTGPPSLERPYGDDEWLESEILAARGEAVLLEPAELRREIAARAKALAKELGVERMRAPA